MENQLRQKRILDIPSTESNEKRAIHRGVAEETRRFAEKNPCVSAFISVHPWLALLFTVDSSTLTSTVRKMKQPATLAKLHERR